MVQLLKEMEEYAKENNIPIMMDDGLKFIEDYIKKNFYLSYKAFAF